MGDALFIELTEICRLPQIEGVENRSVDLQSKQQNRTKSVKKRHISAVEGASQAMESLIIKKM